MTWRGEHYESDSGGPKHSRLAPFSIQASPAASAWTWAFEIIGTAAKSKASRVFPGGNRASPRWCSKRRRFCSAIPVRRARPGSGGGPALLVGGRCQGGPDRLDAGQPQLAQHQFDAGGVDHVDRVHAASPTLATIWS